jgi:hypothetical protein
MTLNRYVGYADGSDSISVFRLTLPVPSVSSVTSVRDPSPSGPKHLTSEVRIQEPGASSQKFFLKRLLQGSELLPRHLALILGAPKVSRDGSIT